MIGVIDYGGGNLRSVLNMLRVLGMDEARTVASPADFDSIEQLVFPGVGAFGDCARQLDKQDLRGPLLDWLAAERPYFGICLGYQVLFERSEESPDLAGLGHFKGSVTRFPSDLGLKIPHMGWNKVTLTETSAPVWEGIGADPYFYFVHSFFPTPEDHSLVASRADYGVSFASSIRTPSLVATQFHPERSQSAGLRLLQNFLRNSHAEAVL